MENFLSSISKIKKQSKAVNQRIFKVTNVEKKSNKTILSRLREFKAVEAVQTEQKKLGNNNKTLGINWSQIFI